MRVISVLLAATAFVACLVASAQASQGPGIAAGTASAGLQTAMAIVVYGTVTAIAMTAAVRRIRRR